MSRQLTVAVIGGFLVAAVIAFVSAGSAWPLALFGDLVAGVFLVTTLRSGIIAAPAVTHGITCAVLTLVDGTFRVGLLFSVAVMFGVVELLAQLHLVRQSIETTGGRPTIDFDFRGTVIVVLVASAAMLPAVLAVALPQFRVLTLALVVGAGAVAWLLHRWRHDATPASFSPPTVLHDSD